MRKLIRSVGCVFAALNITEVVQLETTPFSFTVYAAPTVVNGTRQRLDNFSVGFAVSTFREYDSVSNTTYTLIDVYVLTSPATYQ